MRGVLDANTKDDNNMLRSFLFQKSLTIFNSALYGGAVVATGVDYFVENSIMLMWVWDKVRAKESEDSPCWFSWAILMIWPVLLILGKPFFKQMIINLEINLK